MHKKSLIPLIAVFTISAGIVYGLTMSLFPDTPEFPRLPTGPGTIGSVIARLIGTTALDTYVGDGTVGNSHMLSGVTASGYLKPVTCTIVGGVMVGVDAGGEAICGPKNKLLVGTWTEGTTATRCPVGTGPCGLLNIGDPLYEGEIIKTNPTHTGTITFADDLSLLRLDVGTVVELQSGLNNAGETVAQAILNNGQLWGRIVSNTGVNIGGGGVIAGVRGTSIMMNLSSTGQVSVNIVDSMTPFAAAHLMTYPNPSGMMPISAGSKLEYLSGTVMSASLLATNITATPRADIYSGSLWVRENTKKDIDYLYQKQTAGPLATRPLAADELGSTLIAADTPALEGLCGTTGTSVYWPSLVGTNHEKCRPTNLYAFADYTDSGTGIVNMNMYTLTAVISSGSTKLPICTPTLGCSFTGTSHIEYALPGLSHKTAKITYSTALPPLGPLRVVASFTGIVNTTYPIPSPMSVGYNGSWFLYDPNYSSFYNSFLIPGGGGKDITFKFPTNVTSSLKIGNSQNNVNPFSGTSATLRIKIISIY